MTCTVSDDVAMPQRNGAGKGADQPADDSKSQSLWKDYYYLSNR